MYSVTALHIKNSLNIKQCRLTLGLSVILHTFALLFAFLQFFEAVVDIAKNTNINSLLLRKQLENK